MTQPWKTLAFRTAMIGAGAAALAGCQTSSPYATGGATGAQPAYPVTLQAAPYSPDTVVLPAAQQPPTSAPAASYAPPQATVAAQSAPLPPLAPPVAPAPPAPPPPPPPAPVFRTIVTGQVVNADGPSSVHVVKSGDTLSSIARQMDISVADLTKLNNIKATAKIHPGQRIKGPPTRGKAYVVQAGDTLSAIGRRFNVTPAQLARANNINANASIRPSQKLLLPSGYRDTGAYQIQVAGDVATPISTRSTPIVTPPASSTAPQPQPQVAQRPAAPTPPPIAPAAASSATIATQGAGKFIWPVEGDVIGQFGARSPTKTADGLDIAAAQGTAVHAAAAGSVIYAGNDLQDYGNMVIIDHGNNFYTAYAHLASIQVSAGTVANPHPVTQGQSIGTVGRTGDAPNPELYFEMRHRNTAADTYVQFNPMLVLPPR